MKKLFVLLIEIVFIVSMKPAKSETSYHLPKTLSKTYNKINISVSPQIELISIIQTIGKYHDTFSFLMTKDSSGYKTDAIRHFKSFQKHPAVLMFDRLSQQPRMLNFSAPSNIMLYTDGNLNLRRDIITDDFVINRAGGLDSLKLLLEQLKDFAQTSSFNQFYNEHLDLYNTIIDNTIKNLGTVDYVTELERFYGKKQKSYNILLVSLYNSVGYGNSLLCSNGKSILYNTMGSRKVEKGNPFFGDENYLKYLIRHEFSHPFVNPLTQTNWDGIKNYAYNYDSIPEVARKGVCGDWQECINEFVIRSVTTQLHYNESEAIGLQAYNKEKSRGVSYLDRLLEKLKYYQQNRDKYPTFDLFYPDLLAVFKEKY